MKTSLERRWTLFPVKDGIEIPYPVLEILDDLHLRGIITTYDVVEMYGGLNVEVWYTNGYIKSTEPLRFRNIAVVQRLNERCEAELKIVELIKQLGICRTPA